MSAPLAGQEAAPVRVHLAPLVDGPGVQTERDWLRAEYERSASGRYRLETDPGRADLILLTDSGPVSSHIEFRRETLHLLTHPRVRRDRSRCLLSWYVCARTDAVFCFTCTER